MGFLNRIFGKKKEEVPATPPAPSDPGIPAAKVGLNGEFDESGLAKRVALAFDNDAELEPLDNLWVAQLSSKVVLKGKVPNQQLLDKAVRVASSVNGATEVDTSQVTVG
ncbi:BON domain-containing protein [Leptolyngbya sp. 7M]|uniref:BON domain-containing protein n=1 Tax=Leptolyngbya sp. 7M TaxID=2812896 RepID=UPI001B8AA62F|nr:BON domain-containing protein [Leptolyngbya sp. 7M]QYO62694.1 BON domain-containing protein [Leptolyngbya sp. 7M]